jgi:4-diphosphocytidyl-2-C-methyl-D-erythritol kinase
LNQSASVFCPAKVNLFLEVHDKRPDGYHNLGTLFQTLDIGDTLHATRAENFSLTGAESVTPDPESNLILKAARRLVEHATGHKLDKSKALGGLHFHLEKTLPAGAGLGGGSTDAAGALQLTRKLLQLPVSDSDLLTIARGLGADIPFFLFGGTAFAEGIGDELKPAPDPFPFHIVIATPSVHVSTAWAYQNLLADRKREWPKFKALYHLCNEDTGFYQALHNDFEAPMLQHFPEIRDIHAKLSQFNPVKVLLSGSGASLFALFTEASQAQKTLEAVAPFSRFSRQTRFTEG